MEIVKLPCLVQYFVVAEIVCVKERLEAPMEEALSSASLPFRRTEFLTYILETRVPGVHFNVDDDVGLTNATTSLQCCDHMIPEWGSDKPAMEIPADGGKGSRTIRHSYALCPEILVLIGPRKVVLSRS